MGKGRIEAFSDGVVAIIITIMVLEMHTPHGADLAALRSALPVFLSYLLSFVFVGIYWNNHHHMFHAVHQVKGGTLWANLHLLFWLSLVPFATRWLNDTHYAALPTAVYGILLLLCGVAYSILVRSLLAHHGRDSKLAKAIGADFKGWISVALYTIAIPFAFYATWVSFAVYVGVAALWLVPDRRFERVLTESHG